MYNVQNTKEFLSLVFTSGAAFKNAKADGSIGAEDLGQLMPVFAELGPALKDVGEIPKELGDLDQQEAEELVAFCQQKLPGVLDKPSLVRKVNAALKVVVAIVGFMVELKKEDLFAPVQG